MGGDTVSGDTADVIVVGAGLAGLVAAAEVADAGRSVLLLDQEGEQSLGGQAFWSLGGLFLVDSPEQRRMGIKDSHELALQDWMGSAQFDRRRGPLAARLGRGVRRLRGRREAVLAARDGPPHLPDRRAGPSAATAGRPGTATRCRASTSPGGPARASWSRSSGGSASTSRRLHHAAASGTASTGWSSTAAPSPASAAARCAPDGADRGRPTNRDEVGDFELRAQAVVVTSGGIGGDHDLVRKAWPARLGTPPTHDGRRRTRPTSTAGCSASPRPRAPA